MKLTDNNVLSRLFCAVTSLKLVGGKERIQMCCSEVIDVTWVGVQDSGRILKACVLNWLWRWASRADRWHYSLHGAPWLDNRLRGSDECCSPTNNVFNFIDSIFTVCVSIPSDHVYYPYGAAKVMSQHSPFAADVVIVMPLKWKAFPLVLCWHVGAFVFYNV